jgi:hypothetical protein
MLLKAKKILLLTGVCLLSPFAFSDTVILPKASSVPENLIRIYIQFEEKMKDGVALEHIHLYDGSTKDSRVDSPFLKPINELWDRSHQRLTVYFHPGRVKTGLQAHNEMGRALSAGRSYRLVIDKNYPTASGSVLGKDIEKVFHVTSADYQQPRFTDWQLIEPKAGTLTPLRIQLKDSYDIISFERRIFVLDRNEKPIAGQFDLDTEKNQIIFISEQPWKSENYILTALNIIEDLAGNNFIEAYDKKASKNTETQRYKSHEIHFKAL